MLVQFSIKNWRSIRDEQTLNLVAATGDELADSNTFSPSAPATNSLLRSLAIYGANAAGKSNVVKAMRTMQRMVLDSAKWQAGDEIPVESFLLDSETENQPSEFEVIFVANNIRYQYGFAATSQMVIEEWLFAFPNGRSQRWFSRAWDEAKNAYSWEMGNSLTGQKSLWQEATRENGLFLSTAVQLNSQQLKPLFDWFKKTLRITNSSGWGSGFSTKQCKENKSREDILAFLKAADLDIDSVVVESEQFSEKHLPATMPAEMKASILKDMQEEEIHDIKTVHHTAQGKQVIFDMDDESDGTQKIFEFAGPWLDSLKHGHVLFIDELHNSLHPKMVQFLVQLFHHHETNPKNAQLVFTTHETSVLNQELFRRDQIWFCEKDKSQATQLYPLTDFSPRKGRENLEASYLAGRYGALPYLRELKLNKDA